MELAVARREITKGKLSDKLINLPPMTGIEAAVNLITGVFQRRVGTS